MNNDITNQAAQLLKLLAHPGRLAIIKVLSQQEKPSNVGTLQAKLDMKQSLMSHHLIKMRDSGILLSSRQGRAIYYELSDPSIARIVDILLGEVLANSV